MAKVLGYKINRQDILEGKHISMEWAEDYVNKRIMRRKIIDVSFGKSPIRVQLQEPDQTGSSCPPPPSEGRTLDKLHDPCIGVGLSI